MIRLIRQFITIFPQFRMIFLVFRKCWLYGGHFGIILHDIFKTRKECRYLKNADILTIGKTLNIYALDDDSINTIKQLSFVSQALRLCGWNVQVVLRNRSVLIGSMYFRAFGINRFVYLDDQKLFSDEKTQCSRHAKELLNGELSLQNVKAWTFMECWIGPQLVATLSRLLLQGSVDFAQPEIRQRLEQILTPVLENVIRAKKLVSQYRADLVLTQEANYATFGPLVDTTIENGCEVIQMIQPWKDDALIFRRLTRATRREHPSSVARETLDYLGQLSWTKKEQQTLDQLFQDRYSGRWFLQERNQRSTCKYTQEELVQRLQLNPKKSTAVVFSQVLWDANLFYGEDLFEDAGEWLVETVRAACKNSELNWLIKLHPANVWKRNYENIKKEYAELTLIRSKVGELPCHVKIIYADEDISTLSLFESVQYGVTVRGTAGVELVCFGKHCVTAGTGRYSGMGFTIDSSSRVEYLNRLSTLHLQPPMNATELQRAKWHAYAAFILRPWTMVSARAHFNYEKVGQSPLDHNLSLEAHSLKQLDTNGDLGRWRDWALSKNIDYIELKVEEEFSSKLN